MNFITSGFHPSFDALSAFADQSELEAVRTRVGRHVGTCASCAATVAEIRALGNAARAVELPSAPAGLWARIAGGANAPQQRGARATPAPEADDEWRPAPALRPTTYAPALRRRRAARLGLGFLAAAILVFAVVVVVAGPAPLMATVASRITFTPFRPAPGTRVLVRYRPTPRMARYDRAILVGVYATRDLLPPTDYGAGGVYDSLATLMRTADGTMVGEFTVPPDFQAAALVVEDPAGLTYDGDEAWSWILVGGDARGKPALPSLLSALPYSKHGASEDRLLDTLQRYFPDHPAGFASARRYEGHGMFGDLVEFFRGAERKYAKFDATLGRISRLDADRAVAMITFANHIEEPAEAAKWTMRFTREHPSDPRAIVAYGDMLHQMLVRGISEDSVRRLIPRLDSLTQVAPITTRLGYDEGEFLIQRFGDDSAKRHRALLRARLKLEPNVGNQIGFSRWVADVEIHHALVANLGRMLRDDCAQPVHSARDPYLNWRTRCLYQRMWAFKELSRINLNQHRTAVALAFADSSIAVEAREGGCMGRYGYRALGSAMLAAGDTLSAAEAFGKAFWLLNSRDRQQRDSLMIVVGSAMDSATFKARVAKAEKESWACVLARKEAHKAAAFR